MNNIPNRQIICDTLVENAKKDKDIVVLCCDSRGSASMTNFYKLYPDRAVEVGIAEQNAVSIAAGMAAMGKKPYVCSPACFLSTRSYEQIKVDVAYSNTNVKLIGISGGVSYGALGMTHHSAQDIAALSAIPNMRIYLPSDRYQTGKLISALLNDSKPAYVRVSRLPSDDIYVDESIPFELNKAAWLSKGKDVAIIACGEMVSPSVKAAKKLKEEGIDVSVLDMYCVKPIDREAVIKAAEGARAVLTVEEHSGYGGLGSQVAQIVGENCPKKIKNLSLPDEPVITGTSKEVFEYYGLSAEGIYNEVKKLL